MPHFVKIPFILFLFSNFSVNCQVALTDSLNCTFITETNSGMVYVPVPEIEPEFPGGMLEMNKYITDNLVISESTNPNSGTIIVEFIVQSSGKITNISLVKTFDNEIGLDLVRLVKIMPDWLPGKCNGTSVPVKYTLPLTIN